MAPSYGDHIKKEREALNLIIRMKRKKTDSNVIELILFVGLPLIMLVAVVKYKEIIEFCFYNQQAAAIIKTFYPQWKSAQDSGKGAAPAEGLPAEQAPAEGEQPAVSGARPAPVAPAETAPGPQSGSVATPASQPGQAGTASGGGQPTLPSIQQPAIESPASSGLPAFRSEPVNGFTSRPLAPGSNR